MKVIISKKAVKRPYKLIKNQFCSRTWQILAAELSRHCRCAATASKKKERIVIQEDKTVPLTAVTLKLVNILTMQNASM